MATVNKSNATARLVVVLRAAEKKRLQKLAKEEKVSASEIVRRSLQAYEPGTPLMEDQSLKLLFAEMNQALDAALESSRASRAEIEKNLAMIRERQEKAA
jgi:hypothetical protein